MKNTTIGKSNGNDTREMQLCQRAAPNTIPIYKNVDLEYKTKGKLRQTLRQTLNSDDTILCAKPKLNKKKNKKFKPQFGFESVEFCTSFLTDLATYAAVDLPDELLRKIEGIMALLLNLQNCASVQQFISAVFLYVRDFYDCSMTKQIMGYIRDVLEELPFSQQSNGNFDPSWLELLRSVQTNWSLVKGNRAFKQFSKLLGVLVTLGLCDASNLTFDIAGFKLFDEDILKKHLSAMDLADAIFGTVTYFAEGFYLCFQKGSLQPLLVNDFSILELDSEYVTILSWWDLVKNGNLEKFLGVSESEFSHRLNSLIVRISNLLPSLTGIDKKLISDKLLKLKIMKNDYTASKLAAGTRKAPFAIELFGDSSQGKTTFGDQLLDAMLTSAGLPIDKEYRASINTADKFVSNWTSDKLVAIFDDLANTTSGFVETAPTHYIIDFCNNQMCYANKAEVDGKGKCFVEPEIVLVTTNKKDLDAGLYSNCPYSIQRRMDLVMTVRCKPEFQRFYKSPDGILIPCGVDSAKVRAHYTDADGNVSAPVIDDIWLITIEQAIRPPSLGDTAQYEPITWRGKVMKNVSSIVAIQCALEMYASHRKNQTCIVDNMRNRPHNICKCPHAGCVFLKEMCPDHMTQQVGLETAALLTMCVSTTKSIFISGFESSVTRLEDTATKSLYKKASNFFSKWDWICFVPESSFENERFVNFLMWYNKDSLRKRVLSSLVGLYVLSAIAICVNVPLALVIAFLVILTALICNMSFQRYMYLKVLKKRHDAIPVILHGVREKYAAAICATAGGIAALYFLSKVYKHYKKMQPEQSALEPEDEVEVAMRDNKPDIWAEVSRRSLPATEYSKRVSVEQLQRMVENNLVYASLGSSAKERLMANLLFVKSNLILIPNHYFDNCDTLEAICYKEDSRNIGGNFTTRLCLTSSWRIPGTDLRLCYTSAGGSRKNLLKYLPVRNPMAPAPGLMSYRNKDGSLLKMVASLMFKETNNGTGLFFGGEYKNLSGNTFNGMCGAVWVTDNKAPMIAGVHLGGCAGTPRGCFGTLLLSDVERAITEISKVDGVLFSGDGENFTPHMLGEEVLTNAELHEKSPLRYLPEGSQFEYYGSCKGQTTSRSDVRRTPISQYITEVCEIENVWGPPKMQPEWFGWQKALENASHPALPFPHDLLVVSVSDYKRDLIQLIRRDMWKHTCPLTDHQNINGIPGCKFIDAINFNTSIGYPLTGSKRKHLIENEPNSDGTLNRSFTPFIMDEIQRCEDIYRRGERAYTIAKACKKDEVLPIAKEKCRIFYGNPITLTFLVRKYYLPVLRFLQMNPLKSECAVGINSHGPEWDEFYTHVMHFGEERIFGGDYGKYDQKLPSQLLLAALRILIDLAAECDYTKEDLNVMRAMSGDIVYSLIAVNGDLIGLQSGTHISGNSLTVILNGICGSLNLRNYFYSRYPQHVPFRSAAHMMTYGDDNIGTVSKDYPEFNIRGCSEFLARYGQEYTMPDKESTLKEYLEPTDFEFLKRFNVYHDSLKSNVGALLEKSIFKSLHCYMRPKKCELTPNEACALNIDGALREWFNHGPDVYEMRRAQMAIVAQKAGIAHMCFGLDLTYEDRVREWKRRYITGEDEPEITDVFTAQAGHEYGDLYLKAFGDFDMTVLAVNAVIIHQDFGEVDILFTKMLHGVAHYVVIEVKDSFCQAVRRRGRVQLRKVVSALHFLKTSSPILGILLTPCGYELVDEVGGTGMWHLVHLPIAQSQPRLETDSQLLF